MATMHEGERMNIVICDDDDIARNEIAGLVTRVLKKIGYKKYEIFQYDSGDRLLKTKIRIDFLFLDIEMPGTKGIDVGKIIKKNYPNSYIFIVTSFSEYLDDAMDFHVFRYVFKPIDKVRFERNFIEAINQFILVSKQVVIETKKAIYNIETSEIISVEQYKHQVVVNTIRGRYESTSSFEKLKNELPENCFFQTHRSYIVNMNYVSTICRDQVLLYKDSISAYLTRRKYTTFKNRFILFIEKNN